MATKDRQESIISFNERRKIVAQRLADLRRFRRPADLPKSAKVLAAEKTLEEWERRNSEHINKHYKKFIELRREIEDALLLGDNEKAVRLLRSIEDDR